MRLYDIVVVLSPEVTPEQATALVDGFKKILTDDGAQLKIEEVWGRRRLAYTIASAAKASTTTGSSRRRPRPSPLRAQAQALRRRAAASRGAGRRGAQTLREIEEAPRREGGGKAEKPPPRPTAPEAPAEA
jgi:hypothetical protein